MARQKHWYGHGVRVSWSRTVSPCLVGRTRVSWPRPVCLTQIMPYQIQKWSSPQVSRIGPLFRKFGSILYGQGPSQEPQNKCSGGFGIYDNHKQKTSTKLNSIKSRYQPLSEIFGIGCVCLGHALSRYGRLQPTFSTAPMGPPQLNDKVATIQRAGCVFRDHVLIAIKNFRR